jgi:hypothetical protein
LEVCRASARIKCGWAKRGHPKEGGLTGWKFFLRGMEEAVLENYIIH